MKDYPAPAPAHLTALSLAVPSCRLSQSEALAFLLANYGEELGTKSKSFLKRIFANPSIRERYFAIASPAALLEEGPDQRMERFTAAATELAATAARRSMEQAGLDSEDLVGLMVNTCTGYLCPGLSSYLIEELGLPSRVAAYDLVGSGCGGAIPNLQLAQALVKEGGPVLSVAVEICSATFQMKDDLSLLLSNALFGDGAAAVILQRNPGDWQLIASASRHLPRLREAIRYVYRDGELHNQLSTNLPELIGEVVPSFVADFLGEQCLEPAAIEHWAIHTGGERIINILQNSLGLSEAQLAPSRKILSRFGNISSPTVLFVLHEISTGAIARGERCLLLAFGAGLSVHVGLLQKC